MSNDLSTKGNLLFTIITKKCIWKTKFVEGFAEYDVTVNEDGQIRNAFIKIIIDENKKGKIELKYAGKNEIRILGFTVQ